MARASIATCSDTSTCHGTGQTGLGDREIEQHDKEQHSERGEGISLSLLSSFVQLHSPDARDFRKSPASYAHFSCMDSRGTSDVARPASEHVTQPAGDVGMEVEKGRAERQSGITDSKGLGRPFMYPSPIASAMFRRLSLSEAAETGTDGIRSGDSHDGGRHGPGKGDGKSRAEVESPFAGDRNSANSTRDTWIDKKEGWMWGGVGKGGYGDVATSSKTLNGDMCGDESRHVCTGRVKVSQHINFGLSFSI